MTDIVNTEDQDAMGKIREIFDRGFNSILEASKLGKEVAELRTMVEELKAEVQRVRDQNRWLDEALQDVRAKRDQLARENEELRQQVATQQTTLEQAIKANQEHMAKIEAISQERDDAYANWQSTTETLDKTKHELGEAQSQAERWHSEFEKWQSEANRLKGRLDRVYSAMHDAQEVASSPDRVDQNTGNPAPAQAAE